MPTNAKRNVSDFMGDRMDVLMFGAVRDGATDCLAAFDAAVTALPRGGRLEIPPGKYKLSGPWVIDKPLVIAGQGDGYDENTAPTCLSFAAGVSGITLPANGAERSVIQDMFIVSLSTVAGSDVGISNASNGVTVKNVTIKNFGSHGLVTDTTSAGNANSSNYDHVRAFANRGHGFYTTGVNSNQIKFTSCSSARNLGWGFYNVRIPAADFVFNNTFDNCHTETNALGSYYENGSDTIYNNCYAEPDGPVGVCNVSGVTVTRVSGQAFAAEWKGIALQLGGTGYGTVVATVTAPDTLTLASAPGDATGTAFMIRINQRAELGSSAQYSTWFSGTTNLNAPFIVPLNVGYYGGTDNGTHMVTQFGRFLKRLNVRGAIPTQNIEDTTINPTGACNTNGTAVARMSGGVFTAYAANSLIDINGTHYTIASVSDASNLVLTATAGVQTGVAYTVEQSRTYEWQNGLYGAGVLSLVDQNIPENILVYGPPYGFKMFKPFTVEGLLPIFRFIDTTPTTGRIYSFRNGFTATGVFSIYDEGAAADAIRYDGIAALWTFPKPVKWTGGAQSMGAANEVVIGGTGSSPQAGTICWGDSGNWELQFGTKDTGVYAYRWKFTDRGVMIWRNGANMLDGTGSPESAVTAPVGSIYMRTDGGANTTLYIKEVGTGNTGWAPIASLPAQTGHAGQFLKTNATVADWAQIAAGDFAAQNANKVLAGPTTGADAVPTFRNSVGADFGSQTAKYFLAAPNAGDGAPGFRAIVASDVPTLNQNTSGTAAGLSATLAIASGGTNATSEANARTNLDVYSKAEADALAKFTDRGDPSATDVIQTGLTIDSAWHDLDLSSYGVPDAATAVVIRVSAANSGSNALMMFRKNGNSYEINTSQLRTQVANITVDLDFIIPLGSGAVIEYWVANAGTWTINIVVKGWWK